MQQGYLPVYIMEYLKHEIDDRELKHRLKEETNWDSEWWT